MTTLRIAAAALLAMTLADCAGSGLSGALNKRPAPQVAMAGRWLLAAPNAPACGMSFGEAPGAQSGAIAPEGGCPGNFFTSRQWAFAQGGLTINDHNNELLAQLDVADGHFAGKSVTGLPVTLTRPLIPANQ
jgi:hypothetical protein